MTNLKRILAGVDGSHTAARGLRFAIERAKGHDAALEVAYAVNRTSLAMAMSNPYGYVDPKPMLDAIDDEAAAVFDSAVAAAKTFDVAAEAIKLEGAPADAIVKRAARTRADAVVIGTHGRRAIGRALLGSVAETVISTCAAPVFVIPQDGVLPIGPLQRAVVCIDGSPASEAALAFALRIAEVESTRLILCTVVENAESEAKGRELFARSQEYAKSVPLPEHRLLHGDAVGEIALFAKRTSADCIFAGTHGRGGIPRLILGSVACGLIEFGGTPVCTARC